MTADELESVMIDAGPGDDVVDLSALDPVTVPDLVDTEVVITSGDGADVITGSGMDDVIQGDAGNDTIDDGAGDDSLDVLVAAEHHLTCRPVVDNAVKRDV